MLINFLYNNQRGTGYDYVIKQFTKSITDTEND